MAHIQKRGPGRWRARYRAPGGSERSRTFARRVDAERWLDSVRGDLVRGTYVHPEAGRRTFGEYARGWQAAQVHRPTTAAQVEANLRNHVFPFFGERALADVRASEIQAWIKTRSEALSPGTVTTIYRYVATIFRAAVADRLIAASPCIGIKLPKLARQPVEPLAVEDVEALAAAMPDRYRALVVLAAGTGLRQGEAFGLTVEHVDFLRRSLHVQQQLVLLPRRPPYLAPPKTAASVRTVPFPAVVVDTLAAHLASFAAGPEGFVFTNEAGEPIRRQRFSDQAWRPAVARAGLEGSPTFHDLRHFYASLLIRHGESVKVVQARLGHASASETLDTYSHLWPDAEDRTRLAVDSVLGTPAASTRPVFGSSTL